MRPFTYLRAKSPAEAAALAAQASDSRFIAGGTNLLDLMKLDIETPAHLIDVNGIGLGRIEATTEGGLRIGALVKNTDLAADPRVRKDYGLSYIPEDLVAPHIADGRLVRVLEDWCPLFAGFHLYYPSRRQASPAFALLLEALRYRG